MNDFNRGNELLRKGKVEEAVAAYQKAIAHDPSFHWYHQKLGEAFEELQHWEKAIAAYLRAIQLRPNGTYFMSSLNRVLAEPSKVLKLSPIHPSEIARTDDENLIFSSAISENIDFLEVNSSEPEKLAIKSGSNLIKAACFSSSSTYDSCFPEEQSYTLHPVYWVRLPWSLIFPRDSLVISQFSKYWPDSLYLVNWSALPQITRAGPEMLQIKTPIKPRIIHEPTILLTSYTYVNYYHWHVNILPIAFSLKDKINLGKLRVISSNLNHWQTRSLQVLGIDCSRVEQVGQTTLLCRSLIYSSHLYASSFPPSQLVKSMFDSLKKSGEKNAYKKGDRFPELILISREDSPNNRKLLNEDEVYKALAPLGFVKVVAGRLSYEQQIQTFARAKVIVAQHGAGLTNMGFAPSGCKVIEIFSENYVNNCFWRLSLTLGHQYAYVINEVDEKYKNLPRNQVKFSAPIDAIVNAVSQSSPCSNPP